MTSRKGNLALRNARIAARKGNLAHPNARVAHREAEIMRRKASTRREARTARGE
jgi:hypothetical protein